MEMTQEMLDSLAKGFDTNVDIVFVIDATGSMQPVIDMVKDTALSFDGELEKRLAEKKRYVQNTRIKVIAFRDFYFDGKYAYDESKFFELPEEANEFQDFVNGIEAKGGGDEPETSLEALVKAMRSDFVEDGDRRRHIIVLFTDASAHPFEEHDQLMQKAASLGASPSYPDNMPTSLAEFYRIWNGDEQGRCGGLEKNARRLVLFAPEAYPWSTDLENELDNVMRKTLEPGDGGKEIDMEDVYSLLVASMGEGQLDG